MLKGYPLYCRWWAWCWHRPVWWGLPLAAVGVFPLMLLDIVRVAWFGLRHWGKL